MNRITVLKNKILDYTWGSRDFIPKLLGEKIPSDIPQAEMWMGSHKKAPSLAIINGSGIPLNELIEKSPKEILGEATSLKYDEQLPFLFKVLSAAKPLSIQAHPDKAMAEKGYENENINNISISAPERNYRDKNHKPELICALTPMWVLKGFREPKDIIGLFEPFDTISLESGIGLLKNQPDRDGLKEFFINLLKLNETKKYQIQAKIPDIIQSISKNDPAYKWVEKLSREYPGDTGILSPLFLNLILLEPGEAIYLPARELHAYLEGSGLEIMANSDNVLRGGLTSKHIDVTELFNVLDFNPIRVSKVKPLNIDSFEKVYCSPAEEFALSAIELPNADSIYISPESRSVEIILCTDGCAEISSGIERHVTNVVKGESVLIPASIDSYSICGKAALYKAWVPTQ